MSLVDMKYTPKEVKEEQKEISNYQVPAYPWGLKLRLEKEEIDKLGISRLPNIGDEYHILATGRVESVAQAYRGSDESTCIEIQIVSMQLDDEGEADDDDEASETKPASERSLQTMLSYFNSKK